MTISDNVTDIGVAAFSLCASLISVNIPDHVTTIGGYAFSYCESLTSVNLPSYLYTIGEQAFYYCKSLTSIAIPGYVSTIGSSAFGLCYSLSSITFLTHYYEPPGLFTIEDGAFLYCTSLTSVTIPYFVTEIGNEVFGGCSNLTAINVDMYNNFYTSIDGVLYNKTITSLVQYPGGIDGTFTMPDSVSAIQSCAFRYCERLTTVTIGKNVKAIGSAAFEYCSSLTNVAILGNVTTIEDTVFEACSNLTSISFLGLVAPTSVGYDWVGNTPTELRGHAYAASNFPAPGGDFYGLTMGSYLYYNNPPVFGTPSPANGSTGNLLNFSWSIPIKDPEGNLFSWTIQCSNGQTNSDTGASNGTKSLSLSGLEYSKSYKIWVNATDPAGSGLYTRKWYNFSTTSSGGGGGEPPQPPSQLPPVFGSPTPTNGSTNQPLSLTWSIPINDPEGDTFMWTIQCSNGQNNIGIGASNGTKTITLSSLSYSKIYKVWVNATDPTGSNQFSRKWYTFSTESYGGGDGGGGSTGGGGSENLKPVANTSAGEPYQGSVNVAILFDGSKSYDPDGSITKWLWVFGDNTNGTGKKINHTYSKAGRYNVTLTVTDNEGATNTDSTTCVILPSNRPPTLPTISGPINCTINTQYNYTAVSTDADNNTIRYSIIWGDETSYMNTSTFLPSGTPYTCSHHWTTAGIYTITVRASDNQTESQPAYLTVLIDVKYIGNLGYLIDQNGDRVYDKFYSNSTRNETNVQKQVNGTYLIDSDGDGNWDYTFDPINGLASSFQASSSKTPGFELIFAIGAIALVLIWKRKRIMKT